MDIDKNPVSDRDEFVERVNETFSIYSLSKKFNQAFMEDDQIEQSSIREKMYKLKSCRSHWISLYDKAIDDEARSLVVGSVSCDYQPSK
jgi:hypothetical protein